MASAKRFSREEYDHLCRMIQRWNENRVELFEISKPNESLEFEGVMRFYFQSPGSEVEKVATKCIRVSNTATTERVIEALVQKFRPDMRMLSSHSLYALYEVHPDQGERKMEKEEHPLLVQLDWARGDREGRFLLRSENDVRGRSLSKLERKSSKKEQRRFSKRKKSRKDKDREREKEREKEKEKEKVKEESVDGGGDGGRITHLLYKDMPESKFTRSISVKNRESQNQRGMATVTDKRRHSLPGGQEPSDATMRVYADFISPDIPCKSLLISRSDTASQVVRSALDKYNIREDPSQFCLIQVTMPPSFHLGSEPQLNIEYAERVLGDQEYPLHIHSEWISQNPSTGASIQFQLRRKSSFNRKQRGESQSRSRSPEDDPTLPALVEIFQGAQGSPQSPRKFLLSHEQTEIGSNVAILDSKSYICMTAGGIKPRHCVISCVNGVYRISPLDKTALIYVDNKQVKAPTDLPHNAELRLGEREAFRFFAAVEKRENWADVNTLPSAIGRPHSSRGLRRGSLKGDNMSKAYSVEDIYSTNVGSSRSMVGGRLKDKARSEHNLKSGDGTSSSGYGSTRVERKFADIDLIPEDRMATRYGTASAKYGEAPPTSSGNKKRHYSAPSHGSAHSLTTLDKDQSESREWILPASLSFYLAQESVILQNMIVEVNGYLLQFKLAPAFGLYMVVKHHLSPEFQIPITSSDGKKNLALALRTIITQFKKALKESRNIAGSLAFWLANTSEFLHFLKSDAQLNRVVADSEATFSFIIQVAYKHFTQCMLKELNMFLPAFCDDSADADSEEGYISGGESASSFSVMKEPDIISGSRSSTLPRQSSLTGMYWSVAGSKIRRRGRPTIGDILTTLSSTVSLLKRCKVNPTLSVMIFSLLFRYISTRLFNKLVSEARYCTRSVGQKMKKRLERVREWAEKEGMELPADNHLCKIVQAAHLLQTDKKSVESAKTVFTGCSKLNSRQISTILRHCSVAEGEHAVGVGFTDEMIRLAKVHTDEMLLNGGMELNLEEDPNLELKFHIPQQGYVSDSIWGIPPGLQDYLDPLISAGLCKMTVSKDSSGHWVAPPTLMAADSNLSLNRSLPSPMCGGSNSNISGTFPRHAYSRHQQPQQLPEAQEQPVGLHHSSGKHSHSSHPAISSTSSSPNSDLKLITMSLAKESESGTLGISIIGGKDSGSYGDIGIFVKTLAEGGAAHQDGRIKVGDQIISVDNITLEGCTQDEAAKILRNTGSIVNLTVAKHAAAFYGLSHIIPPSSPRHRRKRDDIPEGSSHARKAARRQKRERERQRQDRYPQQQQQHEFRLERKRPQSEHLNPSSDSHLAPAASVYSSNSHSPYSTGPRLPSSTNPQFTKWILEQNVHYQTDRGSEIDLRSSRSSLTNYSERDRPGSPLNGYSYQREMGGERGGGGGGYYRPASPPVRDSAPSTRQTDYPYPSSSRYDGYGGSSTVLDLPSEPPMKFSEYAIPEMDESVFHPRPVMGVAPAGGHVTGHRHAFSSVSSQMTVDSQPMLTPYSQQQTPSQQHQQLDRLSMDVMQHTQLSGTSMQGGITSLIPKFKATKSLKTASESGGKTHLDRADLKELEMDEIDLEKQRIRLMLYEQEKQEKEKEKEKEKSSVSCHDTGSVDVLEDAEKEEHCLSAEELRQELVSLHQIVSEQKKKYREIKMAREREEQNLKQAEKELFMECVNPSDEQQWHMEQKRRLREIEKLKSEKNHRLQQIQYNEHRAKNKLKACEAQAAEIRQQLQRAEAAATMATHSVPRSPKQSRHPTGGFKGGYDEFPSKLPPNEMQRGNERTAAVDQSNTIEWFVDSTKSVPAHAISVESVSTAATFDQPEIARELATTISESVLTEPTQDDPAPSRWPPSGPGLRPVPGRHLPSEDFFMTKTHSRNTLMTESDDGLLNQEERYQREHPQSMAATFETMDNSLPSLSSMEDREFPHHVQPVPRRHTHAGDEAQLAFRRTHRAPSNGGQQNQGSHQPAWNGSVKQPAHVPGSSERETRRSEDVTSAHYDVPAHARAAYQQHHPSHGRQHGRHNRSRVPSTGRYPPSSGKVTADVPALDRPVQDAPRLVNVSPCGAPDVVPTSYSPTSPQQRHVTGSESRGVAGVPLPQSPNYPIYDVPPSSSEREKYHVSPQPLSVPVPSHQHHVVNSHMTGHVTGVKPSSPAADNIYDQPRSAMMRSPNSLRTENVGPLYDVPPATRRPAPLEGGVAHQREAPPTSSNLSNHQTVEYNVPTRAGGGDKEGMVPHSSPIVPRTRPLSGHRYGISKPGMGHSYSRGRPDHMQQSALDRAKQYMDSRLYRSSQGGLCHPERIQRQQTDL